MAIITKEYAFEAAHLLPEHDGQCRNLHGHSYKVILWIRGPIQHSPENPSDTGMVKDYGVLDRHIKPLIARLDHSYLNEIVGYPTAENIALWLYKELVDYFGDVEMEVTVCETAKTTATVSHADYAEFVSWLQPEARTRAL